MKKSTFIKRFVALFLVVLMSINTFAAVVGDNDGAAFITKGEFDSLKADFQSQLDRYNSSIDNKVDGAIASYLAGIKVNRIENINLAVENYNDIRWRDNFYCKVKTRTFTSENTYTDSANYEIKVPVFHNQRGVKANTVAISDNAGYDEGYFYLTGLLALKDNQDGIYNGGGNSYIESSVAINSLFINTKKNPTTGQYLMIANGTGPLCSEKYMNSRFEAKPHKMTAGHWFVKGVGGWPTSKTAVTFANPSSDVVLDWSCPMYSSWSSTTGDGVTVRDALKRGASNFGGLPMNSSGYMYNVLVASNVGTSNKTLPNRGKTVNYWENNNQAQLDETNILWFMAGKDVDTVVNVGRYYEEAGETYCEWTDGLSETVTVQGDFTNLTCMGGAGAPNDEKVFQDVSNSKYKNVNIRIPLWNRLAIKNIVSGKFFNKTDGEYLALGQGLPVLLNASDSGTLNIEIKTTKVSGTYGSSTLASDDNKLTIKRNDFLESGEILRGTLNGADCEFNEVSLNKDQKYTIEINNITKGDNVWLRLSPKNTISGINNLDYAKIESLTVKLIVE